ncbi:tripartite ATP-independent periplasmic transporter DctQ [Roseivivax marinus]|uniref:TRAP transporter small permease protein n=1 Tax=Roseivivax marinus TaxID=1379903 RepID=W4HPC0_9RHOB|nr:TRAP transporter small permease subunit [Roseivivax marinus]ETW14539.1 tripartite ATP-independent periplasmic transporter DctQ [Roseivivax marinus]UMA66190.1 TRAP transporter small permease subunit [Roseivivax marinus]SEL08369.1 TRAP-type mannitol/chloroaromatic compound transport system, small permease component [Roseivivax marinus]
MKALLPLARGIDTVNGWIGRIVAWLILASVLVSAGNAIIRKSFNLSSNAWLELQWYLFGAVFLLCAAWTLRQDEHVRVDVLSQRLSPKGRAIIDLTLHLLFLMPFCILMVWLAWPFFVSSFQSGEQSSNAGGLIRWPAKLWVLLGFVSLSAQGLSEIVKRLAQLSGAMPYPVTKDDELPPAAREARS